MTLFDLSLPLFFCSSLGLGWYFSSVSFLLYPGFPLCPPFICLLFSQFMISCMEDKKKASAGPFPL